MKPKCFIYFVQFFTASLTVRTEPWSEIGHNRGKKRPESENLVPLHILIPFPFKSACPLFTSPNDFKFKRVGRKTLSLCMTNQCGFLTIEQSSSWCSWYRGTLVLLTDCEWWFDSGPRVRVKTVDPPKGNRLGQKQTGFLAIERDEYTHRDRVFQPRLLNSQL